MAAKLTPEQSLQRRKEALELRFQGKSYEEIARHFGVKKPTIYQWIQNQLAETVRAPTDEMREFEVARLDKLLETRWERALDGDDEALDRVLKILDKRYRLLGLEAPKRVDLRSLVMQISAEEGIPPDEAMADAISYYPALKDG